MKRAQIVLTAALLFLAVDALAQDSQTGPTDNDLKAGYCFDVLRKEADMSCLVARKLANFPDVQRLEQQICNEKRKEQTRVEDYLAARGYLYGPQNPDAIIIAGNRGVADFNECKQVTERSGSWASACSARCSGLKGDSFQTCAKSCPTPDMCRRIQRCNDLSFLPF
jgi:hypothetical protein